MQLWFLLLGSIVVLSWVLIFARLFVEFDFRARGEPTGAWIAAFGVAAGPLAFAALAARDAQVQLELHCFGRRIPLSRKTRQPKASEPTGVQTPAPATTNEVVEQEVTPLSKRLDDVKGYGSLIARLEKHIEFEAAAVELVYGFRDVALTGKILGALCALSGVLPASVRLAHTPLWDGPERWEVGGEGRIGIGLGLVLKDLLWYMCGRRFAG